MPSLIRCPHCGIRPKEEFDIRGDAVPVRPDPAQSDAVWYDYVYLRNNPMGHHSEFWHHLHGCRRWLVVERDTLSHEIYQVSDAATFRLGGEK